MLVVGEFNKCFEVMGLEDCIEWIEVYGGFFYGFKDMLEVVGDGLIDVGWVGMFWEGLKMLFQNMIYFILFVFDDLVVIFQIMNELYWEVLVFQKVWDDQNVVFFGVSGVEIYYFFINFLVNFLKDLEGCKILVLGLFVNWIKYLGVVLVNGVQLMYYNQIQIGVVDGMVVILIGVFLNKYYEVVFYVMLVGIGVQMIGGLGVNKDIWDGFFDDVKKVLIEFGEEYIVVYVEEVMVCYEIFFGKLLEVGVIVIIFFVEDVVVWVDGFLNLVKDWLDVNVGKGVQEVFEVYMVKVCDVGFKLCIDWI